MATSLAHCCTFGWIRETCPQYVRNLVGFSRFNALPMLYIDSEAHCCEEFWGQILICSMIITFDSFCLRALLSADTAWISSFRVFVSSGDLLFSNEANDGPATVLFDFKARTSDFRVFIRATSIASFTSLLVSMCVWGRMITIVRSCWLRGIDNFCRMWHFRHWLFGIASLRHSRLLINISILVYFTLSFRSSLIRFALNIHFTIVTTGVLLNKRFFGVFFKSSLSRSNLFHLQFRLRLRTKKEKLV